MAHFRGTIKGNRSEASRLGSIHSGLTTTCNGWKAGIRVRVIRCKTTGEDLYTVELTTGGEDQKYIATLALIDVKDSGEITSKPVHGNIGTFNKTA